MVKNMIYVSTNIDMDPKTVGKNNAINVRLVFITLIFVYYANLFPPTMFGIIVGNKYVFQGVLSYFAEVSTN